MPVSGNRKLLQRTACGVAAAPGLCCNVGALAFSAPSKPFHHEKIVVLAVVSLACSMGMAAGDKAPTAQQKLMGTCNTEAAGKKGDERKEFMKSCLSDGKKRQQERMKTCNVDATGKKGDERKAFMSECLKKD
jgi:hypothetical protein